MRVGIARERRTGERRVAATPETVRQLAGLGLEVLVEHGAGEASGHSDAAYEQAGATIVDALGLGDLDVLLHVRPLAPETPGAPAPRRRHDRPRPRPRPSCPPCGRSATPASPRSPSSWCRASRAPSRWTRSPARRSSPATAACSRRPCGCPRFFPLYMTAAGTIPPAKVLVLGAGVAGLQAIGTAKRLGARVSANDVRAASADEVQSMGGTFIHLDLDAADAGGGYARELGADRAARQRELLAPHVADADVLITTAAIPGRPAPLLVTADMVRAMRPGSVVVDLAAESGGNVEGSVAGRGCRGAHGRRRRHGDGRRHEGCRVDDAGRRLAPLRQERRQPARAHDARRIGRTRLRRRGRAGRLPHARRRGAASGDRRGARRRCAAPDASHPVHRDEEGTR